MCDFLAQGADPRGGLLRVLSYFRKCGGH
jgi:hypothetical protein